MIRIQELKKGDIVLAEFEGQRVEGEVVELNHEDREICVDTEVQEFWYTPDKLFPIPLDDVQLAKFHFEREETGNHTVKYIRGPFRILLPEKDNFNEFEMWYREDRRHMQHPISVHELQNHYLQMTKVELVRD
jgi:hypothetical protein